MIIRNILIMLIIGLCLSAIFGGPLMSAFGPSRLTIAGPSFFVIIIIGLAIGCYGTIVGIGGGPIILPTLALSYGWENEHLVATSLFIVLLNATSGSIGYARQKRIEYKAGIKFALAALPGAIISGFIHHTFTIQIFDIIFGIFLVLLAVYTLLSLSNIDIQQNQTRRRKKKPVGRRVAFVDNFGQNFHFTSNDKLGIYMNLALGFFVGFLGIGGGVFQIPILIFLLYYPTHIATATSHFITMVTCACALLPHIFLGNVYFAEALWMGIGVLVGAQIGAWLAPKIKSQLIIYLFVIVLFIFAIKLIF